MSNPTPVESEIEDVGKGRPPASLPPMILPQHGLTRYLRVRVEVDNGILRWERPRTLLGVVPLGTSRLAIPLADVRSLQLRMRGLRPFRLGAGLLLLSAPLFFLTWWMAIPLMVVGLWVILVSAGPRLEVEDLSGKRWTAAICFGHQFDADLFVEAVNRLAGPASGGTGRRSGEAGPDLGGR